MAQHRARALRALVPAVLAAASLAAPSSVASAQEEPDARSFPYLTPAGDLDGDGLTDTISSERLPGDDYGGVSVGGSSVITARRGSDGTVLWQQPLWVEALVPGPLGPGGAPGVLAVRGNFIGGYGVGASSEGQAFADRVEVRDLVLIALSGRGEVVWERRIDDGVFAGAAVVDYNTGRTQAAVAHGYPTFAGTLQATPSPAMDVLVSVISRREVADHVESTLEAIVLDGATGENAATATVETLTRPAARVAGDLDGDGLDDFVVLRDPASDGLTARRGRDGSMLWANPAGVVPFFPLVDDLGDITGDGAEDLAVRGSGDVFDEDPPRVSVLDGRSGSVLFAGTGHTVSGAGDVDGDGSVDLLTQLVGRGIRYRLLGLDGSVLAQREFPVPDDGYPSVDVTADVGDLDGDGVDDAAHRVILTADSGVQTEHRTVVGGRTLKPLFDGPAGEPLLATLDGAGDDLVLVRRRAGDTVSVTAQNGATGVPLWGRNLRAPAEFPDTTGVSVAPADVDGDGVPEVVLNVRFSRTVDEATQGVSRLETLVRAWVLSGTDGTVLWAP